MAKNYFSLFIILCIGHVSSNNQDDLSQITEDDNKLPPLLFRQAQDIGAMTVDIKTLIVLQTQQQHEISDMKTLLAVHAQQQSNIDDMKAEINFKIHQQQRVIDDMKSLINQQMQQRSDMEDKHSVRGSCKDNITGLATWYIQQSPLAVPCDGAGWVVMLRRVDNDYKFHENGWETYKRGFGSPIGSFWLGLEIIHHYTSHRASKLRVELEAWDGETSWAEYSYMLVLDEASGYRLMISGYSGTAGDSLSHHNGMQFTTNDRDNDFSGYNRASHHKGPWWYNVYPKVLLTTEYANNATAVELGKGLVWNTWKGQHYSLKKVEMKLHFQ